MYFLLKIGICQCHVSFQGCNHSETPGSCYSENIPGGSGGSSFHVGAKASWCGTMAMPLPRAAKIRSRGVAPFRCAPQRKHLVGVLTSKKGEGRRTTLADWTWHQAGAIVGCHCSVLWLGRVTTNFRGVDVVPLLGAIVGCHCSVLWLGGG